MPPKRIHAIRLFFENIRSIIVSGDDLSDKDTVILVVGTAGSGKTSFVNMVAQKCHLPVGHELSAGTKKVSPVRCTSKRELPRIVLVDTPPFPDTLGEDEILKWLMNIRKFKVKGVIFLQSITSTRAQPEQDYNRLRRLGGNELRDVPAILVTTFWTAERNERHETRKSDMETDWKSAGIRGPLPKIYDNSPQNAWDIVSAILKDAGIDIAGHHPEN